MNPLTVPFSTSIVFIVFAVTVIAIKIRIGYIMFNLTAPKNGNSIPGCYVPKNKIGSDANINIMGLAIPPNFFISSMIPIKNVVEITNISVSI